MSSSKVARKLHKVVLLETIRNNPVLAQRSITTLLRHCFEYFQHCSNMASLCCAKHRRCKSSHVTSPLGSSSFSPSLLFLTDSRPASQSLLCLLLLLFFTVTIIKKKNKTKQTKLTKLPLSQRYSVLYQHIGFIVCCSYVSFVCILCFYPVALCIVVFCCFPLLAVGNILPANAYFLAVFSVRGFVPPLRSCPHFVEVLSSCCINALSLFL